jgi:hypothetical protein
MFLAIWCLVFGSCTKPHIYPICFYQEAPKRQRFQEYYAPQLTAVFSAAIKNRARTRTTITPDGRWLVAHVTKSQNSKLAKVWPRVACIGNASDSPSTKQEADCVAYVSQFVTTKNYFAFGNARDAGGFDIWNESPVKNTLVRCDRLRDDDEQSKAFFDLVPTMKTSRAGLKYFSLR